MKVLQHTLKLAMIAIVLVFTSCSKDDSVSEDNAASDEPTNHELLMTGQWYIQSTSDGGNSTDCERQAYLQFIDEDTLLIQGYYDDGELNCLADPIRNISYEMDGDDTINYVGDPTFQLIIEYISITQLVLRQTDGMNSRTIHLSK